MKILHTAETIKGGVASVIKQLVTYQSLKYDIKLLIPDSQSNELDDVIGSRQYYFRRTGRNLRSFLSLFWMFTKLVIKDKPNIIHIHSTFAGVICRLSLIFLYPIRRPKVIYCPHAFSFLMPTSKIKLNIYVFIERFLQCITDKIICTSRYEEKKALSHELNSNKLQVIYNGISFIKKTTESPYKDTSKKYILFVGRFDKQKGYDYLINLIRKMDKNKFSFTIIGDSVHDHVEKLNQENVEYLGWLKYENIIPYFKHSTVLIMPSRWESFGLVAVEAQSFGLPVIANKCSSLPEVVLEGKTGYLFDFDHQMEEIIDLFNNKSVEEWSDMENECVEFVSSRFSFQLMNNMVDKLYTDLNMKNKK